MLPIFVPTKDEQFLFSSDKYIKFVDLILKTIGLPE